MNTKKLVFIFLIMLGFLFLSSNANAKVQWLNETTPDPATVPAPNIKGSATLNWKILNVNQTSFSFSTSDLVLNNDGYKMVRFSNPQSIVIDGGTLTVSNFVYNHGSASKGDYKTVLHSDLSYNKNGITTNLIDKDLGYGNSQYLNLGITSSQEASDYLKTILPYSMVKFDEPTAFKYNAPRYTGTLENKKAIECTQEQIEKEKVYGSVTLYADYQKINGIDYSVRLSGNCNNIQNDEDDQTSDQPEGADETDQTTEENGEAETVFEKGKVVGSKLILNKRRIEVKVSCKTNNCKGNFKTVLVLSKGKQKKTITVGSKKVKLNLKAIKADKKGNKKATIVFKLSKKQASQIRKLSAKKYKATSKSIKVTVK